MAGSISDNKFSVIGLTREIVAVYVANNSLSAAELPALIANVHAAVFVLASGGASGAAAFASEIDVEKPNAAQIRKSVQSDGIVSFIDGKIYKTLKRHLTCHGLDPRSYREYYGLPV